MERIAVKMLSHGCRFVIYEQPRGWFRRPSSDRARLMRRVQDTLGEYEVIVCDCPELRGNKCYVAAYKKQLGTMYNSPRIANHAAFMRGTRRAIAALLNIARRDGYEFRLIP